MKSTIKRNLISSPKYLLVLVFWQSRAMKTKRVGDDLTASFTSNSNFFCFCFTAFRFNEFRWRWRQNNETIEGTNEKKKLCNKPRRKKSTIPKTEEKHLQPFTYTLRPCAIAQVFASPLSLHISHGYFFFRSFELSIGLFNYTSHVARSTMASWQSFHRLDAYTNGQLNMLPARPLSLSLSVQAVLKHVTTFVRSRYPSKNRRRDKSIGVRSFARRLFSLLPFNSNYI